MKLSGLLIHPERINANDNQGLHPALRIWVILADQNHMRVYCRKGQDLALLGEGIPKGREVALPAEAPFDRVFSSCSRFIRHTVGPHTSTGKKARDSFAEKIANWLQAMQQQDMYDRIVIAAPPKFLGSLRKALPASLTSYIAAEINKDLIKMEQQKLKEELSSILWLPVLS